MRDLEIRDLRVILITAMCDMTHEVSCYTQETLIIVAEIVRQSSRSSVWHLF